MTLSLYNTLSRKKEEFTPLDPNIVRFYSCGPTVYDYAHIGNFRAYVCVDLLKRALKFRGFDVMHVMNITDVDDKIIRKSIESKKPAKEITEFFTNEFFRDLDALKIEKADIYPKATEHILGMVRIIQQLLKNGHAYKSDDGSIYYNIATFKDYGCLSHSRIHSLQAGARVKQDTYDKENARDFALWKSYDKDDGDVFWETELGKGRPGWHIECSAMSIEHLGESFDIHGGGVDLIFPHHENEIAQSEGATGKPFSRYWFHNEHLLVDGKKMSKSLGNFYTLRDLIKKGHKPSAIRYFLLSTHYRVQLNLTEEGLRGAQQAVTRINDFMRRMRSLKCEKETLSEETSSIIEKARQDFTESLDDDLNISNALAHLFDFIREINALADKGQLGGLDVKGATKMMEQVDAVLGVIEKQEDLGDDIQALVDAREAARKSKDFRKSDEIRSQLKEKGILLEDSKEGVVWKRA